MTHDRAEAIAIQALAFLAADADQLGQFMVSTGLTPDDLKARASDPDLQVAILDHVLANDAQLLMFATQQDVPAEDIWPARVALGGTHETSI